MKKILFILLMIPVFSFSNWFENIKDEVLNDTQYLNALKIFNQSKENKILEETILPNISIENGSFQYLKSETSESSSLSIPFRITSNIFDINFSLNTNFSNRIWDDWRDTYSFSISKEIFSEKDEDILLKEINTLNSKWNYLNTKNLLFINYITKGYNNNYYSELYMIQQKLYLIQKREFENNEKKYKNGLLNKIDYLNSRKSFLNSEIALLNANKNYEEYKEYNYGKINIINLSLPSTEIVFQRYDIVAESLNVKLSEIRRNRIYRLYLPDILIGVSFDFNYKTPPNNDEKELRTSAYLNFSYPIYNRGYRDFQKNQIILEYQIAKKEYENKLKEINKQLNNYTEDLKKLELLLESKKLDLEIKNIDYEMAKERFEKGLISEDSLEKYKLYYNQSILEYEKGNFDIFIQKLNIYNLLGIDLIQFLEEESK
ncbi:hypothetical protein JCM30566_02190 [Marinitoga arctica]